MKRILAAMLALALAMLCAGCGSKPEASEPAPATQAEAAPEAKEEPAAEEPAGEPAAEEAAEEPAAEEAAASFPWTIELREAKVHESLHTGAGVQQYDGSVLDVDYDDAPSEGCVFLILTFTITKTAAGGGAFDWAKLSVRAADGQSYPRMKDDAFIQNHTYNRIAGTSLMIGENKGSACFEIPADAAKGELTLVYDAGDAGSIELPVKPE